MVVQIYLHQHQAVLQKKESVVLKTYFSKRGSSKPCK